MFLNLKDVFKDVGYKGEIGYQTFLYSNEPEIRSLLMFLVEKLPRERAEASDQSAGTPGTPVQPNPPPHYKLTNM